jgi:hypothetical protein
MQYWLDLFTGGWHGHAGAGGRQSPEQGADIIENNPTNVWSACEKNIFFGLREWRDES